MNVKLSEVDDLCLQWFKRFKELAPQRFLGHRYDTGKGSPMAASAAAITTFLNRIQQGSLVLDAGAGATTWVFNNFPINVVSIDENPEWLSVVATVCAAMGAKPDVEYEEWPKCDYCFFDYSHTPTRAQFLPKIEKLCSGLIYVDDYDHRETSLRYKEQVDTFADSNGFKVQFCNSAVDDYGRSGAWLLRRQSDQPT